MLEVAGAGIVPLGVHPCSGNQGGDAAGLRSFPIEIQEMLPGRTGIDRSPGGIPENGIAGNDGNQIPPVERFQKAPQMPHLQCAGIFQRFLPGRRLLLRGDMFHPIERGRIHVKAAVVIPDVGSAVAIAAETGQEGNPSLRPGTEIHSPQAAVPSFVVHGRTVGLPIIPDGLRLGRFMQRRGPLGGPPVVAGPLGYGFGQEDRCTVSMGKSFLGFRPSAGDAGVHSILLMGGKRMGIGIRRMDIRRNLHPGVVVIVVEAAAALGVEVVVHLLGQGPEHRIGPEAGHPIAGKGLQGLLIGSQFLGQVRREEELRVRVDQTGIGDKLIISIGRPESGDVFRIHTAVLQMEGGVDRFALDHGEALLHPAPDNALEMVVGQLFRVHAPMGVTQVEKGRSIGIHQVLCSFPGLDEAVPVDSQTSRVFPAAEAPLPAIQGRVVRADAFPGPAAGFRQGETDHEPVPTVPEGGNRQRPAGPPACKADVHPDPVSAPGVVTPGSRERQFAHPPGFRGPVTGEGRQRYKQRENLSEDREDVFHNTRMVTGPSRPEDWRSSPAS